MDDRPLLSVLDSGSDDDKMGRKDSAGRRDQEPLIKLPERHGSMADEFAHSKRAYWIMTLLGLGLLLPWNVCLNTLPYLELKDPGFNYGLYMTIAYVYPQVPIILGMVKYAHKVSYTKRIVSTFTSMGLLMAVLPAAASISKWLVLLDVLLIGASTAVLQSSLFGFASQFPAIFNQALMTGQGVAGICASVLRIITKASLSSHITASAVFYYTLACVVMLSCAVAYLSLLKMEFAQFHLAQAQTPVSTARSPKTPRIADGKGQFVEAESLRDFDLNADDESTPVPVDVWSITKRVGVMAFIEFYVFFVTFAVFPDIVAKTKFFGSPVKSSTLSDVDEGWWTIVLFFLFNIFDTVGRSAPGWIKLFSRKTLVVPALLRTITIVFWVMASQAKPHFIKSDIIVVVLMILFSITNGYVSSLGMMYGPPQVAPHEREMAGFILSLFLQSGIMIGSSVAFGVDRIKL